MPRFIALAACVSSLGCTTPLPLLPADGGAEDAPRTDVGSDPADAGAGDAAADASAPVDAPRAPFEGCPPDALRIDDGWGDTGITTSDHGAFRDNIVAVRFVPTAGGGTGSAVSTWVEYGAAAHLREAILSTRACDFADEHAPRSASGAASHAYDNISPGFIYLVGASTPSAVGLEVGREYYINLRNRDSSGAPSCTIDDCAMRGAIRRP